MGRSLRYLQLAGVQVTAIAVTIAVCVFTTSGQDADQTAMVAAANSTNPMLLAAQHISANYILIVAAVIMLASLAAALVRRRFAEAAAAGVVFIGSSIVTQILKHEVIARPELADGWGAYGNSLPSGHATIAIAAACAALFAAPPRMKFVLAPALVVWASVAGMGVIAAGWHRPSDVVTASLVVGFWSSVAALFVTAVRRGGSARGSRLPTVRERRFRAITAVLIFGAAMTAIALCASYAAGPGRTAVTAVLTVTTITATVLGALAASAATPSGRHRPLSNSAVA
ncbi:phosphatase PAP2 family protein [Microbacterium sp. cf332]|uniref:phosphatase PAP2 family protein n=1 Tax=Microbacterium sp. cf332 TaxID=1761804 RepID=UPI00088C0AC8|nr:phosphatase PAP2 family protein [Microbacterium sp. cf332]SDQ08005.1 PAP2 superfamily protein [Microbacterium sp. cf332]